MRKRKGEKSDDEKKTCTVFTDAEARHTISLVLASYSPLLFEFVLFLTSLAFPLCLFHRNSRKNKTKKQRSEYGRGKKEGRLRRKRFNEGSEDDRRGGGGGVLRYMSRGGGYVTEFGGLRLYLSIYYPLFAYSFVLLLLPVYFFLFFFARMMMTMMTRDSSGLKETT